MSTRPYSLARHLLMIGLITGVCIACDQFTKSYATKSYEEGKLSAIEPITFLGDTFRLQYTENTGAFLGLGGDWAPETRFWVFTVITGVMLLFIGGLVVQRGGGALRTVALALVLSGGIGNLIDRARHGAVVDFMNLGIGPVRTGIFNVADMAITFGVLVLVFLPGNKKPEEPLAEAADAT